MEYIYLGDPSHLSDIEWSRDYGSSDQRSCVSSFYVSVILERKDAVMLALLGKQRGRNNEQSL